MDGCEEPAPPRARRGPRVAGPRASAASPAALVPAGAGREGAELCGAYVKAAPRRRRAAAAGRRDPHPAVLKCVYARPATLYVYVLLRFYITTVAISRGRTLSWRSIDLCARADGSPRGSAAATSGSRDNPVPAATGRTLHRARPPSPFPPAPPPPHVCACAVLREPQP